MPSFAAAACADFSFRDDMATISISALFIMPGMTFMWLIQTIPNPNAGVWMALIADFLADDWKVIDKIEAPKPLEEVEAA